MLCPKCNIEMDEVRKLDVIIDACSKCGGIWLDKGELDKIRSASQNTSSYDDDHYLSHNDHQNHADNHGGGKKRRGEGIADIFDIFG